MRVLWLLPAGLLAFGALAPPADAQGYQRIPTCGTGAPPAGVSPGYMDSTGLVCGSATVTGTVTATTSATASTTPTAVAAGTGKPINISLFSELFTGLSIGGVPVPAGHGTAAAAMRVELPTDGTGVVGLNAGSAIVGKVGIDQTTPGTTNGVQVNAALPAGANVIGKASIDQTTPGTTNAVQPIPGTSGGLSVLRKQVANNTTSFAVDASPGQLYGIEAYNNGTTIAYVKLYNAAQGSTTCGSGTPVYQGMIPAPSSGGGGYISINTMGVAFSTAITACVTTGFADNDTTAPAATTYAINFFYR